MNGTPVNIPIGRNQVTVHVPNLVCIAEPSPCPGVPDPRQEVRRALHTPIASPPLSILAQGRKNAVIVVNDITRP